MTVLVRGFNAEAETKIWPQCQSGLEALTFLKMSLCRASGISKGVLNLSGNCCRSSTLSIYVDCMHAFI